MWPEWTGLTEQVVALCWTCPKCSHRLCLTHSSVWSERVLWSHWACHETAALLRSLQRQMDAGDVSGCVMLMTQQPGWLELRKPAAQLLGDPPPAAGPPPVTGQQSLL